MISDVYISGAQATLLILMIFLLALSILFKKARWYPVIVLFLIAVECIHFIHKKQIANQQTGLISSVKGATVINFINGQHAVLLLDKGEGRSPDPGDLGYAFSNFWIKHGVSPPVLSLDSLDHSICNGLEIPGLYCRPSWRGNNVLITFNEKRLILLRDNRFYRFHSMQPLQSDLILITNDLSVNPERIAQEIQFKMIIISGSVKKSRIKQWKRECEKSNLAFYVIPEQGAFRMPQNK